MVDDIDSPDWSVLLPEELVLLMFKFLQPGDILAASQTCQLWREYGENDKLWEQICTEAGIAFNLTDANLSALENRRKKSTIAYSSWKESFLKTHKIARKLCERVPKIITMEISHNVDKMEIFNERIVSSDGFNLYIFCTVSGQLLHTLEGHTGYVEEFKLDNKFIVSGNSDRSLKVWKVDTGSCVHTLLGHLGAVLSLKMKGKVAVSGSYDRTLRMWDVKDGSCLKILSGHTGPVDNVQFDGNVVVSSSYDMSIKIWNPVTGECRRTMSHSSPIFSLQFNGVYVVAGYSHVVARYGDDSIIKVWDVTNGVCRHTLEGNNIWDMELQGDTLVCQGEDRKTTAKIWRMSTGDHLQTLAGAQEHSHRITGIRLNGKLVVTSSWYGTVKLWDTTTGDLIKDLLVLESGGRVKKMKIEDEKIVCAVESIEEWKLLVLSFDNNDEN